MTVAQLCARLGVKVPRPAGEIQRDLAALAKERGVKASGGTAKLAERLQLKTDVR